MADAEGISIEETNRIRISLGLKPLEAASTSAASTAGPTVDDEERIAEENLKSLRAGQVKKAEEDALRSRLKKARDRKTLNERLAGKTLADPEGEEEDLNSWIKKTKRRDKELAAQRRKLSTS
jgi:U4/U6.U5 tri-snRNP-associated protein 1